MFFRSKSVSQVDPKENVKSATLSADYFSRLQHNIVSKADSSLFCVEPVLGAMHMQPSVISHMIKYGLIGTFPARHKAENPPLGLVYKFV